MLAHGFVRLQERIGLAAFRYPMVTLVLIAVGVVSQMVGCAVAAGAAAGAGAGYIAGSAADDDD